MNKTSIEWTHRPETGSEAGGFTWNPIRARLRDYKPGHFGMSQIAVTSLRSKNFHSGTFCTRISPGCTHCYASAINKRFGNGLEYTVPNLEKVEFFIDEKILEEPLRRKKPATIFVGDMFDLFHETIPAEFLDRVFNVALQCPQHTFQFLTKRAQRMHDYLTNDAANGGYCWENVPACFLAPDACTWLWFGVSVEDQPRADERIPLLLQTPAAVRFLSVEPMLEAVDLNLTNALGCGDSDHKKGGKFGGMCNGVDWVICGGESGPGARPFNLAWAESLLEQCRAAGVPFFMKQVGSNPLMPKVMELNAHGEFLTETTCHDPVPLIVTSKGGEMADWPEHLRVREFPSPKLVTA